MLANRIARFAARHGLVIPSSAELRPGLLGTVRAKTPIPFEVTNRVTKNLESTKATLEDLLSTGDLWVAVEVRKNALERLEEFVRTGNVPEGCSLLVSNHRVWVRFVPADGYLLAVDAHPESRHGMILLQARFVSKRQPGFNPAPLLQLIAAEGLLNRFAAAGNLQAVEDSDRRFLLPYQRYLENVRQHVESNRPQADYQVHSPSPLRLAVPEGGSWPRAFTGPGTILELPGGQRFTVEEASPEVDVLLCREDAEENLPAGGVVRVVPNTGPLRRAHETLNVLSSGIHDRHLALLEALRSPQDLPPFEPGPAKPFELGPRSVENERQHDAVAMALSCPDVCLIHGPPGTGKTTVICEIIRHLVALGQKVLLVTPTHVAIDNALERVGEAENVVALRLGASHNVDPRSRPYLIKNRASSLADGLRERLDHVLKKAPGPGQDAVVDVQRDWRDAVDETVGRLLFLRSANLVCATPFGIAMTPEFRDAEPMFDVLIMDEASKATMLDFLVPAARAKRWILVGDHFQLAPFADASELASVVGARAERASVLIPDENWPERVGVALRRHFDQRLHPREDVRKAAWDDFLDELLSGSPVRDFAVGPEESAWRGLASDFEDGAIGSAVPQEERSRGALLARMVAELLEVQRVSMPSIFEQLQASLPPSRVVRLNYQHRMIPDLAEFSRVNVYGGEFRSAVTTSGSALEIPTLESPSIWIDTQLAPPGRRYEFPRNQDWTGGDYYNSLEIEIAVEAVGKCIEWASQSWRQDSHGRIRSLELGVVSFYYEHARRLRNVIFRQYCGDVLEESEGLWRRRARQRAASGEPIDIQVSIVDRFQGQEKDIVILTTARSNPIARRGHVDNLNRLNVAVTRARSKRIIIGDASTLVTRGRDRRNADDLLVRLHEGCERKQRWGATWNRPGRTAR